MLCCLLFSKEFTPAVVEVPCDLRQPLLLVLQGCPYHHTVTPLRGNELQGASQADNGQRAAVQQYVSQDSSGEHKLCPCKSLTWQEGLYNPRHAMNLKNNRQSLAMLSLKARPRSCKHEHVRSARLALSLWAIAWKQEQAGLTSSCSPRAKVPKVSNRSLLVRRKCSRTMWALSRDFRGPMADTLPSRLCTYSSCA